MERDKEMKKIIFITIIVLAYMLGVNIARETKFKQDTIKSINYLLDLVAREDRQMKPLLIPKYMNQSNFIVSPDGSAYIPMVYKDKEILKNGAFLVIQDYSTSEWLNKNNSFYDMNLIYKRTKK